MTKLQNLYKTGNQIQKSTIIGFLNREIATKQFMDLGYDDEKYDIVVHPHPLYPEATDKERIADVESSVFKWLDVAKLVNETHTEWVSRD
jgi:hypothetical protein